MQPESSQKKIHNDSVMKMFDDMEYNGNPGDSFDIVIGNPGVSNPQKTKIGDLQKALKKEITGISANINPFTVGNTLTLAQFEQQVIDKINGLINALQPTPPPVDPYITISQTNIYYDD